MRNISRGNRKEFAIFALVIILILGVFIIGLNTVLAIEKKEYTISDNTIAFDAEYEIIEIEQESKLYKKWNQNFYLKQGRDEYLIGKDMINFNGSRNKISTYGDSFEVIKGGEVTKYIDQNEITKLSQDRFFKLEDREYLITGGNIKNTSGNINTKNFLIIQLDKNGNTLVANDEINMKTIKPMKIQTESFEFDIANEKLVFTSDETKEEIDLKKIIGSSNQYIEIHPEENIELQEEKEKEELEQISAEDTQKNNQGQVISTTSPQSVEQTETVETNQNNGGGAAGGTIAIAPTTQSGGSSSSSSSSSKQTENKNKTPLAKSVSLRSVTPGSTSLNIQYAISDAENKYQTVYLDIEGDIERIVALDKAQKDYVITGLTPNTEYKVTLAYKEILPNNTVVDGIEDTIIVRTLKIADVLKITKLTKNKVYFTYKMDPNYAYDSGKVAVYIDGIKQDELEIDSSSALTSRGWSTSINCDYTNEIVLKLEDLTYEGKSVSRDLQARIKLY